jgi:peptidyl-tRNA hydrolase, PTH2 family
MKLAVIVRKDLDMRTGKIAGQVGHASVTAYRYATKEIGNKWFGEGQKKIVLKVSTEQELKEISKLAVANDLNVWDIHDFGLTQVAPDTLTCIAIGPDTDEKIDKVIKDLKLL